MSSAENIFTLDQSHPNYVRWKRAIDCAALRGELVCDILKQHISLRNKKILDIGCGMGGTSIALKKNMAEVFSVDINPKRLHSVRSSSEDLHSSSCNASHLPFESEIFDAVILQDVIEHTQDRSKLLQEIRRVIKSDGLIYLSTPNRFSFINFLSDPHWGLPIVALLKQKYVRFVLHTLLRRENDRKDFAELLSLKTLRSLLHTHGFGMKLNQRFIAMKIFDQPNAIIWSDFHLWAIRWIKKIHLETFCLKFINDKTRLFNFLISPEWYLVCKQQTFETEQHDN